MYRLVEKFNVLQNSMIGIFSIIAAYFDSTITFLYALMIGFLFNVLAGMRADDIGILNLKNFKKRKFKDSLIELFVIAAGTYVIKLEIDLMNFDEKSVYVVNVLIWIAVYVYFRNGFRNLTLAYPKIQWLKIVYYLISFQFKKMAPDIVKQAMEKAEEEIKKDGNAID